MKVMAVNSSPRIGGGSKTEMMLSPLLQGMRRAGAEVEVVELRKKKVNFCAGCFTCWTKTPGVCIHQDDMAAELLPMWVEADICVYATPLYHFTVNAELKAFIERTLPAIEPFMIQGLDGRMTHPHRYDKLPQPVILSVAGFPHMEVFDHLSHYFRFLMGAKGAPLAEIYRPGAEFLDTPSGRKKWGDIAEALESAGAKLVQGETIDEETMQRITQPLGDPMKLGRMANLFWRSAIAAGVSPREFGQKGLMPQPDDIEEFLLMMEIAFNSEHAPQQPVTIQFDFTGRAEGPCHLTTSPQGLTAQSGPAEDPDVVISGAFEDWLAVMSGQAQAPELFMSGKLKAQGDLGAVMGMQQWFAL